MRKSETPAVRRIPIFRTVPFLKMGAHTPTFQLTDHQREELAHLGLRIRLSPRTVVYRAGAPAEWVFAVADGVVKSYRELRSGRRVIGAFLFPRDLFGMAAHGVYVNTTQAITPVTVFRLPVDQLAVLLKHDPHMQFGFLAKVTHELRESQRRTVICSRRDAAGRLAMFIAWMRERGDPSPTQIVPLPMSRSDIAAFLGLSLESVSRAAAELQRRGIVAFQDRHHVRIVNPATFARLAAPV